MSFSSHLDNYIIISNNDINLTLMNNTTKKITDNKADRFAKLSEKLSQLQVFNNSDLLITINIESK